MKLRKLEAGKYITEDGRYQVERQDNFTECSHPQCWPFHREHRSYNGVHEVTYVAWHVWDNETDDYAGGMGPEEYDSKAEAVAWLERHLAAEVTA